MKLDYYCFIIIKLLRIKKSLESLLRFQAFKIQDLLSLFVLFLTALCNSIGYRRSDEQ